MFAGATTSVRATLRIGSPKELLFSPSLLDFLAKAMMSHQSSSAFASPRKCELHALFGWRNLFPVMFSADACTSGHGAGLFDDWRDGLF